MRASEARSNSRQGRPSGGPAGDLEGRLGSSSGSEGADDPRVGLGEEAGEPPPPRGAKSAARFPPGVAAMLGGETTVGRAREGALESSGTSMRLPNSTSNSRTSGTLTIDRRDRPDKWARQGERGRVRVALGLRDRVQERQAVRAPDVSRSRGGARSRRPATVASGDHGGSLLGGVPMCPRAARLMRASPLAHIANMFGGRAADLRRHPRQCWNCGRAAG
jgi:hypothetical protein